MRYRFISITFTIAMVSSCSHISKQEMALLEKTPSFLQITQKVSEEPNPSQASLTQEWWKFFQDPQLDGLIYKAIKKSPTLQEAQSALLQAQSAVKITKASLFPEFHANGEENWQYLSKYGLLRDFFPTFPGFPIPAKFNEIDLSLNFSYELDFWGKNQKKIKAALGLALASEMEKRQTELILCSSVCFAYFSWQAHYAELLLQQKKKECAEKLINFAIFRYENGLDTILPSLEQKKSLETLKQTILDLENSLTLDELFLKNLVGQGPDIGLHLHPSPPYMAHLPSTLNFDLVAQRPDIQSQIWKIEAAREQIGIAKAEFYPDVNLMAFAGLSSLTFSHLFRWASRTGALHPALHLPLFVGGKLEGNLEGKLAEFNKMVYTYNSLLLQAAQEVASEVYTFLSIEKQIESQQQILGLQQNALDTYLQRYTKGMDNVSYQLHCQETFLSEQIYEVQLKQYKILSLVRLLKSLGGGFETKPSSEEIVWNP